MGSSALVKAREHLSKVHAKVGAMRKQAEEKVGMVIEAAEGTVGAVGAGFIDEKLGADEGDGIKVYKVHGVPANLAIGAAGLAAGVMGAAGKHSEHVAGIAKGFLAGYGYNVGRAVAKKTETV